MTIGGVIISGAHTHTLVKQEVGKLAGMPLPSLAKLQLRANAPARTGVGTPENSPDGLTDTEKRIIFRQDVHHALDERPEFSLPQSKRDYKKGVIETIQGWVLDLKNEHPWNDRERGISQLQSEWLFFKHKNEKRALDVLAISYRRVGVMRALADILRDEQVGDATRRAVLNCLQTILVDDNRLPTGATLLWELVYSVPSIVPVLLDCIGRRWNAGVDVGGVLPDAVDSLLDPEETAVTHALDILHQIVEGGDDFDSYIEHYFSGTDPDGDAYFKDTRAESTASGSFVAPPWWDGPPESDHGSAVVPTKVICGQPSYKTMKELVAEEATAIPLLMKIVESCPARWSADTFPTRAEQAVGILHAVVRNCIESWPSTVANNIPGRMCDLIPFLSMNDTVVELVIGLVSYFAARVGDEEVKVVAPRPLDSATEAAARNASNDYAGLHATLAPARFQFAEVLRPKITQHLMPLLLQTSQEMNVPQTSGWPRGFMANKLLGLLLEMASAGSGFRDEIIKTDEGLNAMFAFAVANKNDLAIRIIGVIAHNSENQATLTRLRVGVGGHSRLPRQDEFCIAGGVLNHLARSTVLGVDSNSFSGNFYTFTEKYLRTACMYLLEDEDVLTMVTEMDATPRETLVDHYRVLVCADAEVLKQYFKVKPDFYEPALTALAGIGYNWEALATRIHQHAMLPAPLQLYPEYWNPVAKILHKDNVLYLASTRTYLKGAQSGQAASMLLNRLMHAHRDLLTAHPRGEELSKQKKDELATLRNNYGSVFAELRAAFSHNALYKETIENGVDFLEALFHFPSRNNPTQVRAREAFEGRKRNRDEEEDGVELAKTDGAASEFVAFLNLPCV